MDCCLRTYPIAEEYVQLRWVLRQQNGYYIYPDGLLIDARHPRGLKGAIDAKLKERDTPPHLTRTTTTPTKLKGGGWRTGDDESTKEKGSRKGGR